MRFALPLLFLGVFSGCASAESETLRPAVDPSVAPHPDAAVVVFARRASSCDDSGHFVVVDEGGSYLGDSPPDSRWAAVVRPGEHVFVAWDDFGAGSPDQGRWLYGRVNRIGAMRATLSAGEVYWVEVTQDGAPYAVRKTCSAYPRAELRVIALEGGRPPAWVRETTAYEVEHATGQAALDARGGEVKRRIALGLERYRAYGGERGRVHTLLPGDGGCCQGAAQVLVAREEPEIDP